MLMYTGKFAVEAEQREDFLVFVRDIVAVERSTPGCLSFDIYEDVLMPNTFLLIEQWEDEEALEAHTETAEYEEYDETLNGVVSGEPVWDEYEF